MPIEAWILLLAPAATAACAAACAALIKLSPKLNAFDTPGVAGQVKAAARRVPNTGGIGIFLAIAGPLLAAAALPYAIPADTLPASIAVHLEGARERAPLAAVLLGALATLHVLGLIDDRRPLGPRLKLAVMLACGAAVAMTQDTRLLTLLDAHAGGPWLSVALTTLWFALVANAFNFMDNMDGCSAGTAAVCCACFLATALLSGQWFIAALLATTLGACVGFLFFNFPRARLFMGDGGSLVLGFTLAFCTVRTTYYDDAHVHPAAIFLPLVVLAVPLYDLVTVTAIRLSQGRSPFVGDLQHASHRLVKRGLSKPAAVMVLWGFAAATGLAGVALASADAFTAIVIFAQVVCLLLVLAVFEYASSPGRDA